MGLVSNSSFRSGVLFDWEYTAKLIALAESTGVSTYALLKDAIDTMYEIFEEEDVERFME